MNDLQRGIERQKLISILLNLRCSVCGSDLTTKPYFKKTTNEISEIICSKCIGRLTNFRIKKLNNDSICKCKRNRIRFNVYHINSSNESKFQDVCGECLKSEFNIEYINNLVRLVNDNQKG